MTLLRNGAQGNTPRILIRRDALRVILGRKRVDHRR